MQLRSEPSKEMKEALEIVNDQLQKSQLDVQDTNIVSYNICNIFPFKNVSYFLPFLPAAQLNADS